MDHKVTICVPRHNQNFYKVGRQFYDVCLYTQNLLKLFFNFDQANRGGRDGGRSASLALMDVSLYVHIILNDQRY